MPVKELTTAAPEPREHHHAIQVVITLPVRPRRRESRKGEQADAVSDAGSRSRIPRTPRLMALAIKFQEMIERGEVVDYADLARLGYVTRARITQIMNMLNLAPDIQEEILFADFLAIGNVPERRIRSISQLVCWTYQRRAWTQLQRGISVT